MKNIILAIVIIFILGIGWYLISPVFIDNTVNESIPIQDISVEYNDSDTVDITSDIIIGNDIVMNEPMMEMEPTTSVETRGSFVDADNFHKGSGEVKIIKDGEQTFLRFENFSVTNGPDLFVTLNKGDSPKDDYIIVEPLKGNKGDQNYDISKYNINDYQSVSIYCKAFSVEFATAQL